LKHKLYKVDLIILGGGNMAKWKCIVCGYIYDEEAGDPDSGVNPGTKFEEVQMIEYARSVALQKICLRR